jgi:hypothetical protein
VEIEVKGLPRLNGMSIEMAGAKNKWTGRVRKAAGARPIGDRCEHSCIRTRAANLTRARILAFGHAGDAPEDYAEGAAQYVSGFAGRKKKRLPRGEFEAQRKELKLH